MTPNWWCTLIERYTFLILLCCSTSLANARNPQCPTNATAAVQQLSGWNYLGCYHDTWNDRLLKASSVKLLNNTAVGCAKLCSTQGYTVFGVEDNLECYCDTALLPNANTSLVEQVHCNSTCCGDASVLCGGVWFIDVYQVSSGGGQFTTRDRIAMGISIGVIAFLTAVTLGWIYYNRRYLSKSKSLLPRFASWTRINSDLKAKVKVADRKRWKWLFLKNPLRHWQDTDGKEVEPYSRDIQIAVAGRPYAPARAKLDTQCQSGNWISWRLLEDLGKIGEISEVDNPPNLVSASGHIVTPCGSIYLEWRWNQGDRIHRGDFYVFTESAHLDVIFGANYIATERLLAIQERSFLTLARHKKETDAEKAKKVKAKEQQEKDSAAVSARIEASRNKEQQKTGQSSQSQAQQQGQHKQ